MLTEIRAKNSSEKMQLMDELTEGHSPPEMLTVPTRRPKLYAFLWNGSSPHSHHIFNYNLSYYYAVIYVKYTQIVIFLHDSRRSRLLHPTTLNNLSSSPLLFHQVQKCGNVLNIFPRDPNPSSGHERCNTYTNI